MKVDLANVDRRCWRYRPGENDAVVKKIFDSPELVPSGEGWVDTPEKLPGRSRHAEYLAEIEADKQRAKDDEAALAAQIEQQEADKAELAKLQGKTAPPAKKPGRKRAADKADGNL